MIKSRQKIRNSCFFIPARRLCTRIFFYLFGLLYIAFFSFSYRLGLEKLTMTYLVCKVLKFILSAFVLIFYGFVIRHEVVAFIATFMFFYFAFLIFETRFFLRFEEKLKLRQKNKK